MSTRAGSIRLGRMNFALLGTDSESVALAQAAEASGHSLVWCGDIAEQSPWPAEDWGAEWEALLDEAAVDGVIVGRGQQPAAIRGEQVNLLTKNGIAVLTTFPLVESVLTYYEIDMSRGESDAVLQHYNPLVEQRPILERAAEWVNAGHPELGPMEQVVWERALGERSRPRVLRHFSRDVELLQAVAGRLHRLGSLGSPDEAATYAGLSVQLLGRSEIPVRWQVGPVEDRVGAQLVLIAERGKLTVEFNEAQEAVQLTVSQQGETETRSIEPVDAAAQALERFVAAAESRSGAASTWSQALAAMELADTIEISLRRGRMIEVHQQQLTEQLAFKGTMSALGCAVLLLIPPLLLFLGWIAELIGLPIAKYWPHALLLLLAAFLSVQLIPKFLFRRKP